MSVVHSTVASSRFCRRHSFTLAMCPTVVLLSVDASPHMYKSCHPLRGATNLEHLLGANSLSFMMDSMGVET